MSKDNPVPGSKAKPSKKKGAKISPADDMIKTSKSEEIELWEEELNRVVGGHSVGCACKI